MLQQQQGLFPNLFRPLERQGVLDVAQRLKTDASTELLTKLLKIGTKTICTLKRMMDKNQFPTCVRNQYILAMKYSRQAKLELLNSKSVQQPYDLSNIDDEEQEAYISHQHVSHFSDNKHHNKVIDGMTVDIGTNFDWSESLYK